MAMLMDQVRKWNLKFQGENPDTEDVEEKAIAFEIPLDKLPQLRYRSKKPNSFDLFFISSRMRVELEGRGRFHK